MKKKTPIKTTAIITDAALMAEQAQLKLNTGQYKEAIELYKQLLKQADNNGWRQGLAQSYLLRALLLAKRDMVKEGIVLWENYSQHAKPPYQAYDCYIGWLFQTNNMAKVKTSLAPLSAQQLDEGYPELASLLGLLILTEKPELEAILPKESAFISHLSLVKAALTAYRDNKPDDIEPFLKQLPFRSAFRDFRTLFKAALLLPKAVEEARALLAKIPAASSYHQAAQLLLVTSHEGATLVSGLLQFNAKQRLVIGGVKSFSKKQSELLNELAKQKGPLSDKMKFNCAIQYRELFGAHWAQDYCSAALMAYPAGQRDFNKYFDSALDEFGQYRLKALKNEQDGDFYEAEFFWYQAITLLKQQLPSNAFKIALIMRHVAAYQQTPKEAVKWLIDSLEYDPNDRGSYLTILKFYEHRQRQADVYKQWLDKSIKAFPQDVDFLALAIKASIANKAFKKATQYANNILKIDPVNTFAKQVLFTSHLSHARKLIKTKKFHLVDKEIQQAEKLTIGKRYQAQAQLLRGFFVLLTEDRHQGLQQINGAVQKLTGTNLLCSHFCIIVEALLLGLNLPPILKDLPPPPKKYLLPEQEMGRLVQLIQQYHNEDKTNQTVLCQALDKVKAYINQSIKQKTFAKGTLISLCQCLDDIRHFDLLGSCAKIALPQWREPIWVFYKVYAGVKGQASKCSYLEIAQLKLNYGEAKEQSDQRTATLISNFIQQYYDAMEPFGGDLFDDDDDDEDFDDFDDFNPFAEAQNNLFGHLPQDQLGLIERKVDEILSKNNPERLFKTINKLLPNSVDISMLVTNPSAFIELVMLHAANELGIATGITAKKILEHHNLGAKPPIYPFF